MPQVGAAGGYPVGGFADYSSQIPSPEVILPWNPSRLDLLKIQFPISQPINGDDVAVDDPGVKLVTCHVGNPWKHDCQEVVREHEHVAADLCGHVPGNFTSRCESFAREPICDVILSPGWA